MKKEEDLSNFELLVKYSFPLNGKGHVCIGPYSGVVGMGDFLILEGTEMMFAVKGIEWAHRISGEKKPSNTGVLLDIKGLDPSVFIGKKLIRVDCK